jgi:hypothetical protein
VAVRARVALGEGAVADATELHDRGLAAGEVRVAVAEILGQVEAQAVGELDRARDGVLVVWEPVERVGRRDQDALVVAAPLALAAVERRAFPDRDENVLQLRSARMVGVRVAGHDRLRAKLLREVAQRGVAPHVPTLVGALELDVEAIAERARDGRGGVGIEHAEPSARATGEADEAVVQLQEQLERQRRRQRWVLGTRTRLRVRRGQKPAEVRVAAGVLDEQRDVRAALERHLRAGDRPYPAPLRRVRELERPVDAVVVRQGQRLVAELGSTKRELLGYGRTVEKRVRRVAVELGVCRHYALSSWPGSSSSREPANTETAERPSTPRTTPTPPATETRRAALKESRLVGRTRSARGSARLHHGHAARARHGPRVHGRRLALRAALAEPRAALLVAEDDDVLARFQDDLEVAPLNGLVGPPAVDDAPFLTDQRHALAVDEPGHARTRRHDERSVRLVQSSRATNSARCSGIRDQGATSTTDETEPEPVLART